MNNVEPFIPARHCLICDHRIPDIRKGSICGLTKEKPAFTQRCQYIELKDVAEAEIIQVNENLILVQKEKMPALISFYSYIGGSIAVILGGYMLHNAVWESGFVATLPIVIMAIGVGLIPTGTYQFSRYKQRRNAALTKKKKLEDLLNLYSVSYSFDTDVNKTIHGHYEFTSQVVLNRKN